MTDGQPEAEPEAESGPVAFQDLKFDERGLLPAVVQDADSGDVLMVAWMNLEAVQRTVLEGRTWFYSRSRRELWPKGETSGHIQHVEDMWLDCDADTILLKVHQVGAACHTGERTCFHRRLADV
jgi:phosphoribosyl-AMP cyclohydrolase